MTFGQLLDILALISAVLAAILWIHASRHTLRRVTKNEELAGRDRDDAVDAFAVAALRHEFVAGRGGLMSDML